MLEVSFRKKLVFFTTVKTSEFSAGSFGNRLTNSNL